MKRPVVYLIVALLTFLVGFYVSDFGECNRPFGPRCCWAHPKATTYLTYEVEANIY